MASGVSIQARIDPQIKEEARGVLDKLGMSMSEAIVVYLKQIIMRRGIPFELKLPNETTIETFKKTDAGEELHRVSDINELAKELKSWQQPPAGKFTKKFRDLIRLSQDHLSDNKIGRLQTYGKEACARLDRAEAINKDLLTACEAYIRHMELHDSSEHPKANMFCTECPRYRKQIEDAIAQSKQSVKPEAHKE